MTELTRKQIEERDEMVEELDRSRKKLERAQDYFNDYVTDQLWPGVLMAAQEYNDVLSKVCDWYMGIHIEIQEYINSKPERWRESAAGDQIQSWLYRLISQMNKLETLETKEPEELNLLACVENAAGILEYLPETSEDF